MVVAWLMSLSLSPARKHANTKKDKKKAYARAHGNWGLIYNKKREKLFIISLLSIFFLYPKIIPFSLLFSLISVFRFCSFSGNSLGFWHIGENYASR